MTSKTKKRKQLRKTPPLTRDMLLPIPADVARDLSLQNHMALVALRQGEGSADLARELLVTVYWTYFASDACAIDELWDTFVAAEHAAKLSLKSAGLTAGWKLDDAYCRSLESILRIHDTHLSSLPLYKLERARRCLSRAIEKGNFPNLAAQASAENEDHDERFDD